jgi:C1A family cysteine protease
VVPSKKNLKGDIESTTPIVQARTNPVNWTAAGKMSPVKDQGSCGSCYAFSAVAAIESANLIQNGESVSLSEQQVVDCSSLEGNYGCNGGWPSNTFVYVINNNITTSALYPYTGVAGKCQGNGGNYRISSYKSPIGCKALIS